ncbi:hypothetical protein Tco_0539539 [Tanacetum coccineum]
MGRNVVTARKRVRPFSLPAHRLAWDIFLQVHLQIHYQTNHQFILQDALQRTNADLGRTWMEFEAEDRCGRQDEIAVDSTDTGVFSEAFFFLFLLLR